MTAAAGVCLTAVAIPNLIPLTPHQEPAQATLLTAHIIRLREHHQPLLATPAQILHIHTILPAIMVLLQLTTPLTRLQELYRAAVHGPVLPASARQVFTGCLIQAAGVWQMAKLMYQVVHLILPEELIIRLTLLKAVVVRDIIGTAEVVSARVLLILLILLPAHTNTVAPRVITGTAQNAQQAAMKVQAGQILLPDHNPGVNLLQAVVAPTLIGIMAVVTAEAQALIMEAPVLHPAINARV
jgi:hypothetical protein